MGGHRRSNVVINQVPAISWGWGAFGIGAATGAWITERDMGFRRDREESSEEERGSGCDERLHFEHKFF